jgi:hypothetical protein
MTIMTNELSLAGRVDCIMRGNYRTCMVCQDRFHLDDGDDYILGFVCAGCDEEHRERVVPVVDLVAALDRMPIVVIDDRRFVCADYNAECRSEDWHGCNDCINYPKA